VVSPLRNNFGARSIGILELDRLLIEKGFDVQHSLNKGEVTTVTVSTGSQVMYVTDGLLWVTRYDDSHDYFLAEGDYLQVLKAEKIVIEAFRDTTYQIVATDDLAVKDVVRGAYTAR
jgi:Cu2+-containing amine oxidase